MTTVPNPTISNEEAALFFRQLKKDLNCRSTKQIVSLVRIVLSKIRTGYTSKQLTAIGSKTPSWFHLLLVDSWQPTNEKEIQHIDELVDDMVHGEYLKGSGFFTSEIEALNSVITVLKRIHQLFKRLGIDALNYTLLMELKYCLSEDVN